MSQLKRRRKYVPNMAEQSAVCEMNFLKLAKLWPDMCTGEGLRIDMATEHGEPAAMVVLCQEQFTYTSGLLVSIDLPSLPRQLGNTDLFVRVYDDLKMAEVVAGGHGKQLQGVYHYPNDQMLQVDEKAQLNKFLTEWLSHALHHGMVKMPTGANSYGDFDH